MAEQKRKSISVVTPVVRLTYSRNLIVPAAYKENGVEKGPPKHSCELSFAKDALSTFQYIDDEGAFQTASLNSLCLRAAMAKFQMSQDDLLAAIKHGGIRWPVKDGDKQNERRVNKNQQPREHYAGTYFINPKSNATDQEGNKQPPPTLFKPVRGEDGKPTGKRLDLDDENDRKDAEGLFLPGNFVKGRVSLVAGGTEEANNRYITMYLNSLIFVRTGPRIQYGMSAEATFGGIDGGEFEIDPTEGMELDTSGVGAEKFDEIPM